MSFMYRSILLLVITSSAVLAKTLPVSLFDTPTHQGATELVGNTDPVDTLTTLPKSIHQTLHAAGVPDSAISIIVQPIMQPTTKHKGAQTPLLSHLPHKKRLPASTLKIVPTYAALDALGPEFHWINRVYYTGRIVNGTLHGDLIIKGSGDPKLVREYIEDIYAAVRQKGITHIQGNLLLDNHVFGKITHDPAAFDGEPYRPYNTAPDGLLVNFKSIILKFDPIPSSGVVNISHEPAMADMRFHTRAVLSEGSCGRKTWQDGLSASFTADAVTFSGHYPISCGEREWAVALPAPERFAPRVLKGMWLASGGTLSGDALYAKTPTHAKPLLSKRSLPLKDIIKDINQYSNNVMTEQVFLSLPRYAKHGKYTHQGTYTHARRWLTHWWRRHLPKATQPIMSKASGLCRSCYVTPDALNALLQHAAKHKHASVFKASLGVAGHSGTIKSFKYRMKHSPANGRAYIKTGTIDQVASIAGYIDAKNGTSYSVVAIINHANARKGRAALDELMDWVARQ